MEVSNRDKIIYLKQYVWLNKEIDRKVAEIDRWRSRLGKITATLSDMPGGGGSIYKNVDTDIIVKITDLDDEINASIDRLIALRGEIEGLISSITDPRERLLLQFRYIDGKQFEVIAAEMFYNWRWVHRLHSRALAKIEIGTNKER
jgi:DNA-directed RNA polymerase specialized sigma subunit